MKFPGLRFACTILALLSPLAPPAAIANPYEDYLSARILPGWREEGGRHVAALELTLADGWKTYWRLPGSAGIPPHFDWSASGNLSDIEIVWPRPEVFDQSGMRSIGYHDRVVLPLRIQAPDGDAPIELRGDISLGICDNVCVPLDVQVSATLPAGGDPHAPRIAAALAGQPYTEEEARVQSATCAVTPAEHGLTVEARLKMPSAGGREVAVFEAPGSSIMMSDAVSQRRGDTLVARTKVMSGGQSVYLDRSKLKITVLGSDYAVEIEGCEAG